MTATTYHDDWIECTPDEIRIRGYYFPWGTKHIRYSDLKEVHEVRMDLLHGKGRIWGTSSPRVWASLDPHRAQKSHALVLDVGRRVRAFITPDNADAALAAIAAHTDAPVVNDAATAPLV